jgi:ribosomal protein L37AE/L43A
MKQHRTRPNGASSRGGGRVSPFPVCPRCGSSAYVQRGGLTLQPGSWLCRDCLQKVRHLSLAVEIWRVWGEAERIAKEAA